MDHFTGEIKALCTKAYPWRSIVEFRDTFGRVYLFFKTTKTNHNEILEQLLYSTAIWKLPLTRTRKDGCSTGEECEVFRWALYLVLKFQRTGKTDHANIEIEWNHYKRTFIRIKWSWERHSCDADLSNCKLGVKKYFWTWMYININKQHWRNEHFLLYMDIGARPQKNTNRSFSRDVIAF